MPAVGLGRWQAVAALSVALGLTATVINLMLPVAMDHVWALVLVAASAAVVRALGAGGARSVLGLAATMLVAQPVLHVIGEFTFVHDQGTDHGGLEGLPLIACHIVLFLALTAIIEAGEKAGRAVALGCRRLARVVHRCAVAPAPEAVAISVPAEPPDLSHKQRERVPEPSRRGPPVLA